MCSDGLLAPARGLLVFLAGRPGHQLDTHQKSGAQHQHAKVKTHERFPSLLSVVSRALSVSASLCLLKP